MKRISAQIITLSAFSALSAQDKPNIVCTGQTKYHSIFS